MRTLTTLLLTLTLLTAQSQSAINLGTGSQVRNTIIFENHNASPVSAGTAVSFSASDATLPAGNNNVHLPTTPFSSGFGFEINMGSLAFDRGNQNYLNPTDTLDAGFNPRISCDDVDIGAYEHFVQPTQITVQPTLAGRVCEGTAIVLQVEAIGEGITFQWQRNGVNLIGRTSPTLAITNITMADTGYYRVIVFGACCNDTSNVVRLNVDLRPMVVAMNDTTILHDGTATLYVRESIGTVVWFAYDMETVVLNPNVTEGVDFSGSTQFFAVATNGVCLDTAIAPVQIIVDGFVCVVRTHPDPIVCANDPFRLLIYEATVTARWTALGTGTELPNGSLVRVPQTTRFVLTGFDEDGNVCGRDTITINVPTIDFTVRSDVAICRGEPILLYSTPPADIWFNGNGQPVGNGNITIVPPIGITTTYTAQITDLASGCVFRRQVAITTNPPDLRSLIGTQLAPQQYELTICEDELIHLQTNIDPQLIDWRQDPHGTNTPLPNDPSFTAITTETPTLFRAWAWDLICGDIYLDIEITVQPRPEFIATPQPPVYIGTTITLTSVPNTPIWTDTDGTRIFTPITIYEEQYFIAVFQYGACEVRDTIFIEVMETPEPPPAEELQLAIQSEDGCFAGDGSAFVNVLSGGIEPFTFEWSNGENTQLIENLQPGIFTVTVTDYEGTIGRDTVTIYPIVELQITFTTTIATNRDCDNATVTINVTGGEPPLYFEWSRLGDEEFFSHGQNLFNAQAGIYTVVVTDQRGCETQLQIPVRCEHEQIMPSILVTPNNDGLNDYLFIYEIDFFPTNTVTIINSYGAEIIRIQNFCNHDPNRRWGGKNRQGNFVPDGTYWYVIQAEGVPPMTGWIIVRGSPGN